MSPELPQKWLRQSFTRFFDIAWTLIRDDASLRSTWSSVYARAFPLKFSSTPSFYINACSFSGLWVKNAIAGIHRLFDPMSGIIGSGGWMMQFVIGQSTNVSSRNNHLEPKGEGNNLETRTVSESEANYKFWNCVVLLAS